MSNFTYNPRSVGAIQPFVENNPVTIIAKRDPTGSDKAPIGQIWVNTASNTVFILTSILVGEFVWTTNTGGGGTFTEVTITGPGATTLTVEAGDVDIQAGDLTLDNGDLSVTGDVSVTGNLDVNSTANVLIQSTAASATAIVLDASNSAGGIVLDAGSVNGIELSAGGNVEIVPATTSVASPADTATINKRVGVATFTGFTTAAAASQVLSINNTFITGTSGLLITATNLDVSTNGASVVITGVTQAVGSILFTVTNNGGGALGAGDNILVTFWVIS